MPFSVVAPKSKMSIHPFWENLHSPYSTLFRAGGGVEINSCRFTYFYDPAATTLCNSALLGSLAFSCALAFSYALFTEAVHFPSLDYKHHHQRRNSSPPPAFANALMLLVCAWGRDVVVRKSIFIYILGNRFSLKNQYSEWL